MSVPVAPFALAALGRSGVGPGRYAQAVRAHGGDPCALAGAAAAGRLHEDLPAWLRSELRAAASDAELECAERRLAAWRAAGWPAIAWGEAGYPGALAETPAPPPLLWSLGEPPDPLVVSDAGTPRAVAVVGTRSATPWAREFAGHLAHELAQAGLRVVSGLAMGVDAAAHLGALRGDAAGTIAVLGSGPDRVHPSRHRRLAERIALGGGAVIAEVPPGSEPLPGAFPQRNRIIAGLAVATVVVQAPPGSGALHTVSHALAASRDVWVVPDRPDRPSGRVAAELLNEGAMAVTSARDLLLAYRPAALASHLQAAPTSPADPADLALVEHLRQSGAVPLDALLSGPEPTTTVLARLTRLERSGWLVTDPGGTVRATEPAPRPTDYARRAERG